MLWTTHNFPRDKRVVDGFGKFLPWVSSFDDETKEVEFVVMDIYGKPEVIDGQVHKVKVICPDARIADKSEC